jgi:2-oxoglutarate ferredoxin oxidoreductase subunit alpha
MPKNLGALLRGYEKILVPEMNTGQLKTVLRDQFLVDARPLNKVSGQPFRIIEVEAAIDSMLQGGAGGEVSADDTQLPSAEAVNP